MRDAQMRSKFGISLEKYNEMAVAQGYLCAICGEPERTVRQGKALRLAVDHDRSCCPTDKSCGECIRALLCVKCNVMAERFFTDRNLVMKLERYLEMFAV
jgi:hypothetical protein